ncbi:MAG: hypothetical protein H0X66_02945 [Verrucomicrobia bacterium]|nr:hypothetical protein [Verrucomicrobiota bacterium]
MFCKVDSSLETPITIKNFLEGGFGSDSFGCASDEIPSAIGEFGFDPTNPIPVRGIVSSNIYLERLLTSEGKKVDYKRNGSLIVPNISGNIDEYEISQNGRPLCKLYISPYNQRISGRPPRGFILFQED